MKNVFCDDCSFNIDYIGSKVNKCKGCNCILCDGCKPTHYTVCGLTIPSKFVN